MKKFLIFCILTVLVGAFSGCSSHEPDVHPDTPAVITEVTAPTQQPDQTQIADENNTPSPAPEQSAETGADEGKIYLTVSQITFSLVGESEDIYVGTLPRDLVTWSSDDESIVVVENGVLTAVGTGETIVRAEYGSQQVEAKVGCLAATQEELEGLDMAVLRSPKRMPPVVADPPLEYFEDAVLVGDSITYILFGYENMNNMLGDVIFLTRGGSGINGFVRYYWNIYYRGQEMKLEDALALTGKEKAFFMLGQNDLGYRTVDQAFESWDILLARIQETCPDMEIYLQSCVAECIAVNESNEKNDKIDEYNRRLEIYAQENGYHFVDIAPYAEDHLNRMPEDYNLDDGIHLNEAGCISWMNALLAYAERQN